MKKYTITPAGIALFFILIIGSILRFYNLWWDQGFFLHPDERLFVNASNLFIPHSWNEFFSINSPLNPHMFYYGSFLLYLYKLASILFEPQANFLFISRAISALMSTATIPVIYLLGKRLFSSTVGIVGAFLFAFSVGSIQYAHFNTTESVLVLLLSLVTLLSILVVQQKKLYLFIFLGILIGIALATKITGATFALIPLMSFVFLYFQTNISKKQLLPWLGIFIAIACICGLSFAPYQLIDYKQFQNEQSYMQGVTYGLYKPPFVIIYEHTIPYIFPLFHILPFTFGFLSLPLSGIGLILLLFFREKQKNQNNLILFILIYPLLYFLWAGAWYAKYERYYILLLPFFSIWAAFLLQKLQRYLLLFCLIVIALNGIFYLKVYTTINTRITASLWIYQHITPGKTIATEYWDDALPLLMPYGGYQSYPTTQLKVYDPDTPIKIETLTQQLATSDYLVLSSRRVYTSILQNSIMYPYTSHMYQLLLDKKLGFIPVYHMTNYPFLFSDDYADETFQSYDHPPVIIFENREHLPPSSLEKKILSSN